MKRIIGFSLVCASLLHAADATLEPLTVESTTLNDISGEEVKSADLAEALSKKVPSINLIRRSGIANDVTLRGQKRDNINVTMDGTKVYGACPNRMDPPTSHVLTNNIESVEIIEGPYDVENFGTLSGGIKITMKEPTEETTGEVSFNAGTWGYRKLSGSASGGNDRVQVLFSASTEQSNQYEDGDDNTLAEQLEAATAGAPMSTMAKRYQSRYREMEAYEKKTFMGKVNVNVTEDQQLKLSYTNNQSDDVMYPNSGMDALYDNSKIYNVEYIIRNLAPLSKTLSLQAYQSEVDHPMANSYRMSAMTMDMLSTLSTKVQGAKVKNSFEIADTTVTVGLDASDRKWDGYYVLNGIPTGVQSIDNVETQNRAIFAEAAKRFGDLRIKAGMRYDDTSITPDNTTQRRNDYEAFNANIFATYNLTSSTSIFAGAGKSSRVPDARELYFVSSDNVQAGTETLKQTTNYEIDLGAEHKYEHASVKLKTFYSKLDDYIYYNSDNTTTIMKMMVPTQVAYHAFENIDATIYGVQLSGSIYPTDAISIDMGLAYQRGKKDRALAGQIDKDLADIPPLKGNLSLSYNYQNDSYARVEVVAADRWDNYDADNGEQEIAGYGIVNLKLSHDVNERFNLTAGLDNLLDKTYAVSNSYMDLTLIQAPGSDVMLLNEPGRYLYVNATYKF